MDRLHAFDLDVGNHLTDETIMQAIVWRIFQNLFFESHWRTRGLTFRGSGTFNHVEIPDTKRSASGSGGDAINTNHSIKKFHNSRIFVKVPIPTLHPVSTAMRPGFQFC